MGKIVKSFWQNKEFWLMMITMLVSFAFAVFNFIGQPKKNAEDILEVRDDIKELSIRINENVKDLREQDREVVKLSTKLESINQSLLELRTDIKAFTNSLRGRL